MNNAINEMMQMVSKAQLKKREIEKQLKKIEDKKRRDENELRNYELKVIRKAQAQQNVDAELAQINRDKNLIINDNKEFSSLYDRWQDIDKKLIEINSWVGQATFPNESKQIEAVSHARYVFRTI